MRAIEMQKQRSGADVTRQSLIDAAMRLFGEKGYEAVSTREIADQAAANIGSIAYHFGGKAGLRMACAQTVMERIGAIAAPMLSMPLPVLTAVEAQTMLEGVMENFGRFLVSSPQASVYAAFIIREVMQPGEVVDHMYEAMIGPAHRRLCKLFAITTGLEPETDEVRVAVFSLLGQILYFRVARPIVLKRMEWSSIGRAEADLLISSFKKNLKGLISAYRKG
jgi:TetR/AcrR family transcriptional regulator, regulator of cefoperazone and chloramphenicol sensitivity